MARVSGRGDSRDHSLNGSVLQLQRTAGNAATTGLIQRFAAPAKPGAVDEVKSVPNVRITDAEVLPRPMKRGGPVYAIWGLVNDGTGPTRAGDEIFGVPLYGGTSHSKWDRVRDIGTPPIPANGGTLRGVFKFEGSFLKIPGQWEMGLQVTYANTIGKVADSKRIEFTIPDSPL